MRRALGLLLALGALMIAAGTFTPSVASAQESATARASVSDTTVGWGDTPVVDGSGFKAGARIRIILYGGNHRLADFKADGNGSFRQAITIPSDIGSSPSYQLTIQGIGADDQYGYISIPMTVVGPQPVLSISDDQLGWEQPATVSGQNYNPGAEITVSLFPNNTLLGKGTARGDGRFDIGITIPRDLPSSLDYQIAVTGQGIDLLFHFDVIEVGIIGDRPTVELSTQRVPRGTSVVVTGRLFAKDTEATVTLVPGFEELGTVRADGAGNFSTEVTIPADAFGADPHAIVVTGYGIDAIFTYDSTPILIDPATTEPDPGAPGTTLALADADAPRVERFVDRILGRPPELEPRGEGSSMLWLFVLVFFALVGLLLFLTRKRRPRR